MQVNVKFNASELGGISVPIPSLEEQKRIASELDDQIAGVQLVQGPLQQELETIKAMPDALLRKAFAGEL